MHPLLQDILARRNHARYISSVTILHVSRPAALLGARVVRVPQWDVPSTAAAYIPIIEPLDQVLLIARPPLVAIFRSGIVICLGCASICCRSAQVASYIFILLKSSSHGANWWRLPQPTTTRRIEIKIYTAIDNLILIE